MSLLRMRSKFTHSYLKRKVVPRKIYVRSLLPNACYLGETYNNFLVVEFTNILIIPQQVRIIFYVLLNYHFNVICVFVCKIAI